MNDQNNSATHAIHQQINEENRQKVFETIEDFYQQGGVAGPVEAVSNLLNNFFTNVDSEDPKTEAGDPNYTYKAYSPRYVQDLVFNTTHLINFLIKLDADYRSSPDKKSHKKYLASTNN